MFLFRQKLQQESCLFNLCVPSQQRMYNELLSEVGSTVRVLKQKEWGTTGFAAPDFEADFEDGAPPPTRIKDDAYYIFIMYEKTPGCTFRAPHRAELSGNQVLINGTPLELEFADAVAGGRGIVRQVAPHQEKDLQDIDTQDTPPWEDENDKGIVIDVSAVALDKPVKAKVPKGKAKKADTKKAEAKTTLEKAMEKAVKKGIVKDPVAKAAEALAKGKKASPEQVAAMNEAIKDLHLKDLGEPKKKAAAKKPPAKKGPAPKGKGS